MRRSSDNFYVHGRNSGWTEYRYGGGRPVTLAGPAKKRARPEKRPKARGHLVHETIDLLQIYSLSPFQHEADARHGLRRGFCLAGAPWQEADGEAEAIIAEAFGIMRVDRPDWIDGQRYYADATVRCVNCHGGLDEEDGSRGRRFCSTHCARVWLGRREEGQRTLVDSVGKAAHRLVARATAAPRPCAHCGREFRSEKRDSVFCSMTCAGKSIKLAREARLANVERQCGYCQKTFTPKVETALYCSKACGSIVAKRAFRARNRIEWDRDRRCAWCDRRFEATQATARFCSSACKTAEHRMSTGSPLAAKRLSPPVFDYVFRMAV